MKYWDEFYTWSEGHGELYTSSNFDVVFKDAQRFYAKEKRKNNFLSEYGYIGVTGTGNKFAINFVNKAYVSTIKDYHFKTINNYKLWISKANKFIETRKPQKGEFTNE